MEARAALNLSSPRIHQLLAAGELDGTPLAPGRKRHSPGAPRVTVASVDRYLRKSEGERARMPERARTSHTAGNAASSGETPSGVASSEAVAARAAAQELKVRLDAMRDELAAERERNRGLLDVVDRLVSLLRGSQLSADRLDGVTDGYSQALTQLLTPDPPS